MMVVRDNPTCEVTREAYEIIKLFIQGHKISVPQVYCANLIHCLTFCNCFTL